MKILHDNIRFICKYLAVGFVITSVCFSTPSHSQESNPFFQERTNNEVERRLLLIEGGVSLTTGVTGVLPLVNGGTQAALIDPGADRILFWDESGNIIDWLTVGTGLDIVGKTISATLNTSNVIFAWNGITTGAFFVTHSGLSGGTPQFSYIQATLNGADATVFATKWKKIAGVSTFTVYVRVWRQSSTHPVRSRVVFGSSSGNSAVSDTINPTWLNYTVDVSSETDGVVGDLSIQIGETAGTGANLVYMSDIIIFGS